MLALLKKLGRSNFFCLDGAALGLPSASLAVLLGSEELCSGGHQLSVGGLGLLARLQSRSGGGLLASLSLKSNWRDESLDLGRLGSRFGVLVQVEELSDLVSSLWSESSVNNGVGQAGDVVVALSHDNGGENAQIVVDDATSNGLSLSLTRSAASVAGGTVSEEKSNSMSAEDTLLHADPC